MKNRPALILSIALCIWAAASAASAASFPPSDAGDPAAAQQFRQMFWDSLLLISPAAQELQDKVTSSGMDGLRRAVDAASRAVEKLALDKQPFGSAYPAKSFERFAIPAVFRYKLVYDMDASTEALQRFFDHNPTHYPRREFFKGWAILVPQSSDVPQSARSSMVAEVEQRLRRGEDFGYVAFTTYEKMGSVTNGYLGRIERGQIDNDEFEAFLNADSSRPFFGPVKLKQGILLGKLNSKLTSQTDPFQFYSQQVLADYRREWGKRKLADFYTTETKLLNPQVLSFDASSSSPTHQVCYRIGGRTETFANAVSRLPQYIGNQKDPAFWSGMARHALEDDLILLSTAPQALLKAPEYAYWAKAHRDAYLVFKYVEEQLGHADISPDALKRFYDRHTSDTYAQSDLVRLLTLEYPRTQNEDVASADLLRAHFDEITSATAMRNEFAVHATEEAARQMCSKTPRLKFRTDSSVQPMDNLGRVLDIALQGKQQGHVTPVLVARDSYLFALVLERKERPPLRFEDVKDRVRTDLLEEMRNRLYSQIFGAVSR